MKLKDKVVLITASTRGIGLACVKECSKEGAIVYMAARNLEAAKENADNLVSQGYKVKYVYNDASKPESFISMIEDVIKDSGRIDVLVNNFGTSKPGQDLDFSNTDTEFFLDTVNINLRSVFAGSKEAVKYMAKQGGGSIINISSVGGLVPDISQVAYGTSKAAINYLTKLIAAHEVTRLANQEAQQIVMKAEQRATEIKIATKKYLDEKLSNVADVLARTYSEINENKKGL